MPYRVLRRVGGGNQPREANGRFGEKMLLAADKGDGAGGGSRYDASREQSRGEAAMADVLVAHGDVASAMETPDLGTVDFRWGSDKGGIAHVVHEHGEEVARRIPQILAHGEVMKGRTRVFVEHEGHRAVLTNTFHGAPSNMWVVSAYEKGEGSR